MDELDINSLEPLFALAGIEIHTQGYVSVLVKSDIRQGHMNHLTGKINGKALEITGPNWDGDKFQSDALDIDVELSGTESLINIDRFELHSDWIEATASGAAPMTFDSLEDILKPDSVYDLKCVFECDMATALSQMPRAFGVRDGMEITSGRLSSHLQTLNKNGHKILSGQASLAGLQGSIEDKTIVLSEPVSAVVEVSSNKSGINVDRLDVASAFARIHCTGTSERLDYDAEIDLSGLQGELGEFVETGPYSVAGEFLSQGSVTIDEKEIAATSYHLVSKATEIKHLKISRPDQKPFEQDQMTVAFDAKIDPAKHVVTLQIVSPEMTIHGDLQQMIDEKTTRLEGNVACDYDWETVIAAASPFLPEGLTLEGNQKDTIRFSSSFPTGQTDELLANLNTEGKLGFAKAHYMGLDFGATEMNLQVQKGLLEITPFTTTVNNGLLNLAGGADFRQKPLLFKIARPIDLVKDIQINQETTEKLLSYVNPIFADAVNVAGVANFHCEQLAIPLGDGADNELEVIGTISISQLQLQASDLLGKILAAAGSSVQGQEMTVHPTRLVLQNGFLQYEDMQIDVGDTPLHFQGVIGVKDNSLNMTVTLPYSKKKEGKSISLPLRGTIKKPELDLDKLFEQQLKEQLHKQLGDKIEIDDELGEKILEGLGELFK